MSNLHKALFVSFILFSLLHLTRDISQNYHIQNPLTDFARVEQNWCGAYCDLITYPFELFILVSSAVIIKRNKSGKLGTIVFGVFFVWVLMFAYDYFIFN